MELKIEVDEEFDLEKAVCNYGLFMTLPNQWNHVTKSLHRPLRLGDGCSSVTVSISSSTQLNHSHFVLVHIHNHDDNSSLSLSDQQYIQKQVIRMLRLSGKDKDDVRRFHEMHGEARIRGFGHLFRSPDLFEDIVKTILLCGATWKRTLEMCKYLCELQAKLQSEMHKEEFLSMSSDLEPRKLGRFFRNCKRKRESTTTTRTAASKSAPPKAIRAPADSSSPTTNKVNSSSSTETRKKPVGNFPNSKELAGLSEEFLKTQCNLECNLGYRANLIIRLAKLVENGRLSLQKFQQVEESHPFVDDSVYENVRKKLLEVKGIGPFAAANILMCMGDYRSIPTDSETVLHLRHVHGMENCHKATVYKDARQVFDKFGPYQCLAYWYELVQSYEKKLGIKLSELSPSSYHKVAIGSYLSNNTIGEKDEGVCNTSAKTLDASSSSTLQ